MPTATQSTCAQALKSALVAQEALFVRSSSVSHLLSQGSGLFTRKELVDGAKRGADAAFKKQVDAVVAAQDALSRLFSAERAEVEQQVDDLTVQLLTELGFDPQPSRYKHRRPAWRCKLPHHYYGEREMTVVSISTIFTDKNGEISSVCMRTSKDDDGCTDSCSLERRHGRLAVAEHIDY